MTKKLKRTRTANRTSKAPSIYDVAREAKVSVFTVSAVINDTGRVSTTLARRVEAAVRKLNYRPNLLARSLAKQQTHTLGMVVTDIANPFFPANSLDAHGCPTPDVGGGQSSDRLVDENLSRSENRYCPDQ